MDSELLHMNQTLRENTEAVAQMRKMTEEVVDEMKKSLKKTTEVVEAMKQSLQNIRMRLRRLRQFSANEFISGLSLAYSYSCISG